MKWKERIALAAVFLSTAVLSVAQTSPYLAKGGNLYAAKETSLDLFASYVAPERGISHLFETKIHHGSMGGGLGVNYFASPTLGLGVDLNIPNNGGSFVDTYTANLIVRYPLGKSGLAAYLNGGGGRAYDPDLQWVGQLGLGLEYRTYHKSGLFVDARYVWGEKHSTDTLLLRGGLRLVF